jgi:hypothetical protein
MNLKADDGLIFNHEGSITRAIWPVNGESNGVGGGKALGDTGGCPRAVEPL